MSGNLGNRKSYDVKSLSRRTGALGALYKNEVSNSCAIQKEMNQLFGKVNFVQLSLKPVEQFIFRDLDDWSRWKCRFEQFHLASHLTADGDTKQISMLLYCLGKQASRSKLHKHYRCQQSDIQRHPEEIRRILQGS